MTYPTVVNGFDFRELVFLSGAQSSTDTFKVATAFGKEHKDVLRKTRSVIKSCSPEFAERNFTLCHENNELQNGKPQPFYQMTRDGWTMLVFSFTGKAAIVFKEAYISAFNWMADIIRQGKENLEAERNAVMLEYMKEKDVASMSGRLLNRWGKVKKPQLLARIERIEQSGQIIIPGLPS
ncbi:Rha family transcriptional regulator [Serratia fonticola]|uniref:Rha family transcriptional regulator n=1 Tax=Serratia fonticola TaxID=47917 RepID=UPI0008FCEA78|nr:Rha family transcriptional regulator [Serratia fonticola]OIX96213.1 Rha family transcriptional regulator [Serratia fonticola]QCR60865.1 Rha family transcriptional regulator [Serratia fonticola]